MKLFVEDLLSIITVVPRTLGLAALVLAGGFFQGILLAACKAAHNKILNDFTKLYIWYVRGIPLVVHLFILLYLLPNKVPVTIVLILTYIFYSAVGHAENVRTALNSVPKGQFEAGYSVGMSRMQILTRIILPQAMTVLLPVTLNMYLGSIKGVSLAFMVGVVDIMSQAKLCSALNFGYVEAYFAAAVVYWALCAGLTWVFGKIERILYRERGMAL